jgi:hypothetical protein
MEIAAQHPEGEGIAAGVNVVERLFLDRIALRAGHVTEGDAKLAGLVETDFADAAAAFGYQAAVPAGDTANAAILGAPERADDGMTVQRLRQRLVGCC